jgi:CubicO group peptidase (beta-lactamase class C family)
MGRDHLAGAALVVVHDETVLHRRWFGSLRGGTRIPIASASKWLTAATVMSFVDAGRLTLDDPVSHYLPGFQGAKASVTVRELLAHTSGLPTPSCIGDPSVTLATCVDRIAAGPPPASVPGREFHYSPVGYAIAGRLVEVLGGARFEDVFVSRIASPLGMKATRFDAFGSSLDNPDPAASAASTIDDYQRFLDMMLHLGLVGGRQVLSEASVRAIERDQVVGIDTSADFAVRITKIPTYGLGVWRDVVGPADETRIVSGNGALGFYPWIDRSSATLGIVGVADLRGGSEHAVPASQRIARMMWTAAAGP